MSRVDPSRAAADQLLAEGLRRLGADDPNGALACYAQARLAYQALGDIERVAACDQRAAMAHSDRRNVGDLDRAIELSMRALQFYEGVGDAVAVSKIQVNLSAALLRGWRYADALALAQEALPIFTNNGLLVEEATCRQNIAIALRGLSRFEEAAEEYRLAARLFEHMESGPGASFTPPPDVRRAEVELNAGTLLARVGRIEDALAAFDRAEEVFTDRNLAAHLAGVWSARAAALGRAARFESAVCAADEAAERFLKLSQLMRAAAARGLEARALLRLDRVDDAFTLALDALVTLESGRHSLRGTALRAGWFSQYLGVYDVTCEAAKRLSREPLIAVLIELARTQSLPSQVDPHTVDVLPPEPARRGEPPVLHGTERARSAALAAIGQLPLGPPASPVVAGASVALPGGYTLEIAALCRQVGGPDAWWWGTLATQRRLWWSVLSPDGGVHAGSVDLIDTGLGELLDELARAVPTVTGGASPSLLSLGPFGSVLGRGDSLWGRLGALLLPPPLADALRKATRRRPLSLVVAPSAALSKVAIPVLTVPGTNDTVIDRAVVRAAPSCALLAALERPQLRAPRRGRAPVLLAVLGPTSDLSHARSPGVSARRMLVGADATASAVIAELSGMEPGVEGVAVFATHVSQGVEDVSATAAIVLADRPVEAREFLVPGSSLRSPERVVLAGCASVGHVGGEWLSLGPALLYAGARQVILTIWPLVEDPAAVKVDQGLTGVARSRDPAGALRRLQRRALRRRWRRSSDIPALYRWGGIITLSGPS